MRRRVVIVGGGIAGLTVAHELTSTAEGRDAWDVEVIEMGHRLGGRLASAHASHAFERNEEHGLHVWFGFYDNTFRLAEQVWAEHRRPADCPWTSIWDALRPIYHSDHGIAAEDAFMIRRLQHGRNSDRPGEAESRSIAAWLTTVFDALRTAPRNIESFVRGMEPILRRPHSRMSLALFPSPAEDAMVRELDRVLAPITRRLAKLRIPGSAWGRRRAGFVVERLVGAIHGTAVEVARRLAGDDPISLEVCRVLDLLLAVIRATTAFEHGILEDGDLDRVSKFELKELLARHGASADSLARSSTLECLYDMPFAYLDGDRRRPVLEASTALRFTLRILGDYKHALAYLLSAGAGETLVAPLYEVLLARGVRFRPFHRLARVRVERDELAELVFVRAARTKGMYDPLITRGGLRGFRAEPAWDQLHDGEALRARGVDFYSRFADRGESDEVALRIGRDYDDVVLALPLGAIAADGDGHSPVAAWLDAHPKARACLERLHLVPTVAAQLWLRESPAELGIEDRAVVTWAEPFSVACDMSPVIAREAWPEPGPRASIYLCGALPLESPAARSSDRPARERDFASALAAAKRQYEDHGAAWFAGTQTLYSPTSSSDPWDVQFVRANLEPWELADLPLPGADAVRLEATDTGLANLALAGAWVRTHVNTTSLEAAVASGLAAARALGATTQPILGERTLRRPSPVPVLPGRKRGRDVPPR